MPPTHGCCVSAMATVVACGGLGIGEAVLAELLYVELLETSLAYWNHFVVVGNIEALLHLEVGA